MQEIEDSCMIPNGRGAPSPARRRSTRFRIRPVPFRTHTQVRAGNGKARSSRSRQPRPIPTPQTSRATPGSPTPCDLQFLRAGRADRSAGNFLSGEAHGGRDVSGGSSARDPVGQA